MQSKNAIYPLYHAPPPPVLYVTLDVIYKLSVFMSWLNKPLLFSVGLYILGNVLLAASAEVLGPGKLLGSNAFYDWLLSSNFCLKLKNSNLLKGSGIKFCLWKDLLRGLPYLNVVLEQIYLYLESSWYRNKCRPILVQGLSCDFWLCQTGHLEVPSLNPGWG